MKYFWKKAGRPGFTLIEVLVTVAVIGVLVAVTVPAVTNQMGAADPARVVSDLVNITSGIDAFTANMRPSMPGDVEDLANAVSTTDLDLSAANYSSALAARWKGPYIEKPVPKDVGSASGNAFPSGYSSQIQNVFLKCNSQAVAISGCSLASPDYLVVQISPLSPAEFELVNKLIDAGETAGTSTGLSQSSGRLRYSAGSTTAYFFATPLLQ